MTDILIQQIWQDIKDPAWDNIQTYDDFVTLPDNIKSECKRIHNFTDYINQALDEKHIGEEYVYKNLAFVPILKCGHSYFRNLFVDRMQWQSQAIDTKKDSDTIKFGVIMHPLERWLKGTTEWIWRTWRDTPFLENWEYCDDECSLVQSKILMMIKNCIIGDKHTIPYHMQFGSYLSRIAWIPLAQYTDKEVKEIMMSLFQQHRQDIILPINDERQHTSNMRKLSLYNKVKELYLSDKEHRRFIYNLLKEDLKFYHGLCDNFRPDWSHLV